MTNTMEWEEYRDGFDKAFNEAIDRGEPAIVVAWVLAKKLTEKILTTARKEERTRIKQGIEMYILNDEKTTSKDVVTVKRVIIDILGIIDALKE
jgi:hypothetical protein